jgi:hypothetical protein
LKFLCAGPAFAQQRFLIERDIPGASKMTPGQLRDAARTSNRVLKDLGPDIQWMQSYVAGDKIYCVYNPQGGLDPRARQQVGLPGQPHHASRGRHPPHHGRRVALSVTCAVALRLSAPST